MSSPEDTWISLATTLSLPDLVAAGDHLILDPRVLDPRDPRPYCTLPQLQLTAARFRGRGAVRVKQAANLIRQGAESRPESLLRLLLAAGGLPEPTLQRAVHDSDGKLLGIADMLFEREKVAVEYDGEQHRLDSAQYNRDVLRRENLLEELDSLVTVRKGELFGDPESAVRRVRRALKRSPHASR